MDFAKGDRVEHVNCGVGTVTQVTAEGNVCVTFDQGGNRPWKGEYDQRWFELHPNWLVKVDK